MRPDEPEPATRNLQGKHVARRKFAAQLDSLIRAGYRFLEPDDLRQIVRSRKLPGGRAALVTFDDGYANVHTHAFPILRERQIPAIVFVVGRFLAEGEYLWVDRLEHAFMKATSDAVEVGGHLLWLRNVDEKRRAESLVRARWKRLNPTTRETALDDLISRLQPQGTAMPLLYEPLSWAQASELRDYGWEIGSHTLTHTILAGLDDHTARVEIEGAKTVIETALNVKCDLFAYPNGLRGDFTPRTQQLLIEAGKTCALASIEGRVRARFAPYAMCRVSVRDRTGNAEFRLRTLGAVGVAKRLKARLNS